MNSWTLDLPVPVEFGAGSLRELETYLDGMDKALIVTGRHAMKATGVTDRLCSLLRGAGVNCRVYDKVSAEPDHKEVEEAASLAREFGAQVVIGCGGGSALDAAKATAVGATHPGPIFEYTGGGPRDITNRTLPIIAITSTSGTGSHVGRVAVLSDRSQGIKRALASNHLYPRAAFCDPEILRTMPPELTATSGFDAFAQALEGYLSSSDHPMGNLCAQEAMHIIYNTLPKAVEHGDNLDFRLRMAWADTLSGISLATNAVLIPHVISMAVGGRYKIAHGRAIAAVMVACLEHSRQGAAEKLAQVARLLGCREAMSDDEMADWAIDAIERFIRSLGLDQSLMDYGAQEEDFEDIAREVRTVFGGRVDADPVPTDVAGLVRILERSVER